MQKSSALERARTYLREAIDQAHQNDLPRLPPIKIMARKAGVSHTSINQAVSELKNTGVLHVGRSRGITIPSSNSIEDLPLTRTKQSAKLRNLIACLRRDLLQGVFGFNHQLPFVKELTRRYGVSYRTLHKALSSLVDERLLVPFGLTYKQSTATVSHGRNVVVLFTRGSSDGNIIDYTKRSNDDFLSLEQECLSRNLQLRVVCCYFAGTEMTFPGKQQGVFAHDLEMDDVLGFIFWAASLDRKFVNELAIQLKRFGKPIALFVENMDLSLLPNYQKNRLVRYFGFRSDPDAGRMVGHYLFALGHKKVCCFTAFQPQSWSIKRIAAIKESYALSGYPDAVTVHTAAILVQKADFSFPPWAKVTESLTNHIIRAIEKTSGMINPGHGVEVAQYLDLLMERQSIRKVLDQAFESIAADRSITAWVGANDEIAILCLNFLREKGVSIPGDISVIGFDDTVEARLHGLTSYSFNGPAAMHAMIEFILSPLTPLLVDAGTQRATTIEGFIHERRTTGMPAKKGAAKHRRGSP